MLRRATTAYSAVGPATAFVQSAAVLEVLHAWLGWVRSPVQTTAMQVSSRLFLVWGVTELFEVVRRSGHSQSEETRKLTVFFSLRLVQLHSTLRWSSPGHLRKSSAIPSTHALFWVKSRTLSSGCATPHSSCSTLSVRARRPL